MKAPRKGESMRNSVKVGVLFIVSIFFSCKSFAYCFNEAGEKYKIDPALLKSIAMQESGLNAKAINKNKRNGKVVSIDYGVMQINSTHIPGLIKLGVIKSHEDLLNNPCLNVQVGAWVLAKHLRKCGVNWECLGSYNGGFSEKNKQIRLNYAKRIYSKYLKETTFRN